MGLPPSMLCDRETTNIAKAQVGFIDFFIKPPFASLSKVLVGVDVFLEQLNQNQQTWRELIAEFEPDKVKDA